MIVAIVHDITSLKECTVFYSMWILSVELAIKLKFKLLRLSLRHLATLFIIF